MQTAPQLNSSPAVRSALLRIGPVEDVVYKAVTVGAILLVLSTFCIL